MMKKAVAIFPYIIISFLVVISFFLFSFLSKTLPDYVNDTYEVDISKSNGNSSSEYEGIIFPWSFYENTGDILSEEDGALVIEEIIYNIIIATNPETTSSAFNCHNVMNFDKLHRFVFVKDYIYYGNNGNRYCLNASYDILSGQIVFLKCDLYNENNQFNRERIILALNALEEMLLNQAYINVNDDSDYLSLLENHENSFQQYLSDILSYVPIPNNLNNDVKIRLKDNDILVNCNGNEGDLILFYSPEEERFTGYSIENK